jgi:hypothetical protein
LLGVVEEDILEKRVKMAMLSKTSFEIDLWISSFIPATFPWF